MDEIRVCHKIVIKNLYNEKLWKLEKGLHDFSSKRKVYGAEFIRRTNARESADIIYVIGPHHSYSAHA